MWFVLKSVTVEHRTQICHIPLTSPTENRGRRGRGRLCREGHSWSSVTDDVGDIRQVSSCVQRRDDAVMNVVFTLNWFVLPFTDICWLGFTFQRSILEVKDQKTSIIICLVAGVPLFSRFVPVFLSPHFLLPLSSPALSPPHPPNSSFTSLVFSPPFSFLFFLFSFPPPLLEKENRRRKMWSRRSPTKGERELIWREDGGGGGAKWRDGIKRETVGVKKKRRRGKSSISVELSQSVWLSAGGNKLSAPPPPLYVIPSRSISTKQTRLRLLLLLLTGSSSFSQVSPGPRLPPPPFIPPEAEIRSQSAPEA